MSTDNEIKAVTRVTYEYTCCYCGKTYRFESAEKAEEFVPAHKKTCSHNLDAKRCHTCGHCYLPNDWCVPFCEIGRDVYGRGPCPMHNDAHRPHKYRKVPVLKKDHTWEKLGITIPKGTLLEYFYGDYVIHRIPSFVRKNIGVYANDLTEYRLPIDLVVWVPEDVAVVHAKETKEEQWNLKSCR